MRSKKATANSWRVELLVLPLADALALSAAFFLAYWLRMESGLFFYGSEADIAIYALALLLSLPLFLALFYANHLYDPHDIFYGTVEYVQVIKGVAFGILGVIVINFILHDFAFSRGWLLLFWLFATLLVGLTRFGIRRIIRPIFRSGKRSELALVVGASEEASAIAQTLMGTGRMEVVGFLDDFSPVGEEVCRGIVVKGSPDDYARVAREEGVSQLILVPGAVSWETYREILSEATKWDGLNVLVAPRTIGLFSGSLRVSYVGYLPMLRFRPGYMGGLDKLVKATLDWTLGAMLFVASLPLLLVISSWIMLRQGWPVWEGHKVLGLYQQPFYTYKFRTGFRENDCRHSAPAEEPRASSSKRRRMSIEFLLKSGLDKLPQLVNVLRGQMSLVGPRTIYYGDSRQYGDWLCGIMAVKPGITGPWAISDASDLEQEIAMTLAYIHTWTPWKDLQILILTLFFLVHKRLRVRLID